ncbi:MAG: hypothetical protein WA655_08870 [Candidatus Korobacteraceae bacterium]
MTCREFKHTAASLTMWELSRSHDAEIVGHAENCIPCSAWLQKQRSLAASMQMLQARTAGLEAGPSVEQALLRAFRQVPRTEAAVASLRGQEPLTAMLPGAARSTPLAMRLSRWFETGAYAAVAAAIVVGIFLGVRLLHDRHTSTAMQSQSAPASTAPVTRMPDAAAEQNLPVKAAPPQVSQRPAVAALHGLRRKNHSAAGESASSTATDDSQTTIEAVYTPLMFCDALSCSSDSQVVRMELPSAAGQDAQPQVADVVVGYDGVVRAVRIVN